MHNKKMPCIKYVLTGSIGLAVLYFWLNNVAFAAGQDLLSGTTQAASATFNGSGKFYIYLAEIVAALMGYIMSRKLSVFIGIIVVAFIVSDVAPHFLKVV